MPIVDNSVPGKKPNQNYDIGKYMDFVKFVSLIQNQALFFSRINSFEDRLEGTTPKATFEARKRWFKEDFRKNGYYKTDEEITEFVTKYIKNEKPFIEATCVNCWNKFEKESVALWKIYSDISKGILIKSSIDKIEKSFRESQEIVLMREIEYIDYSNEGFTFDGNTMAPIVHKHNAFSYEDEIRLSHEVDRNFDWNNEENKNGVFIKVDLNELIEEIIISPYAPKWFYKMIDNLIKQYRFNFKINRSNFSI